MMIYRRATAAPNITMTVSSRVFAEYPSAALDPLPCTAGEGAEAEAVADLAVDADAEPVPFVEVPLLMLEGPTDTLPMEVEMDTMLLVTTTAGVDVISIAELALVGLPVKPLGPQPGR